MYKNKKHTDTRNPERRFSEKKEKKIKVLGPRKANSPSSTQTARTRTKTRAKKRETQIKTASGVARVLPHGRRERPPTVLVIH